MVCTFIKCYNDPIVQSNMYFFRLICLIMSCHLITSRFRIWYTEKIQLLKCMFMRQLWISISFLFFLCCPRFFMVIEINTINNQNHHISCYLIYLNCYWVDFEPDVIFLDMQMILLPSERIEYKYESVFYSD